MRAIIQNSNAMKLYDILNGGDFNKNPRKQLTSKVVIAIIDATTLIGSANVAHLGIVGKENIFFYTFFE